jgi:Mitochondrial K+-H+ exchange-related
MDVFVIPVGADQYVLYYEHTLEAEPEEAESASTGVFARWQRRFSELLRAAEEHRQEGREQGPTSQSWTGRMQDRMMAWIAKRVAEQRLLWNLRKQEHVVAVHPSDMTFDAVTPHIQQALQRDYERHRNWLIVDTIGLVVSGLLAIVPGPNLLAYYFLFRVGGHWLSMRGATQGRRRVAWEGRPCEPLNGLRDALRLPRRKRQGRVQQIASTLHLRNLATFFERVTAKSPQAGSCL